MFLPPEREWQSRGRRRICQVGRGHLGIPSCVPARHFVIPRRRACSTTRNLLFGSDGQVSHAMRDARLYVHPSQTTYSTRNYPSGMRTKRYYVYIVASKSRVIYVGMTGFLMTRVLQHKRGEGGAFSAACIMPTDLSTMRFSSMLKQTSGAKPRSRSGGVRRKLR